MDKLFQFFKWVAKISDFFRQRSSKRNTESKQPPLVDNKQSPVINNDAGRDIYNIYIQNNYYNRESNSKLSATANELPKDSEEKASTRDRADKDDKGLTVL